MEQNQTMTDTVNTTRPHDGGLMNSPKKKAIFLDLDGTFWDREVVPDSAWAAVKEARKNGHLIFVNTGRRANDLPQFLWEASFDGYCLASGMDLYRGREHLRFFSVPAQLTLKMVNYLKEHGYGYTIETLTATYESEGFARRRNEYFRQQGRKVKGIHRPIEEFKEEMLDQVVKVCFNHDHSNGLREAAKEIGFDILEYRHRFNPNGDDSTLYRGELTWNVHNKANAMETILSAMNIDRTQYIVVAIGDAENDIPMLEAADLSICMGHATKDVEAVCDFKTTDFDEDGIWKAFEKIHVIG